MGQTLINGLITGTIYALIAAGFSLVYSVHRFFYIAHGGILAVGAFAFYWFAQVLYVPIVPAALLAVLSAMTVATLNELLVHRPLWQRKANDLTLFLASTAAFILIENILLWIFGPTVRTYRFLDITTFHIAGIAITNAQLLIIAFAVLSFFFLFWVMYKTHLGTTLRAISGDRELAKVCGIEVGDTSLLLINISAVLAAIAGILQSLEQDLLFDMGLFAVLKGIIGAIIGGIGNVPAAVLGGIILGLLENFSLLILPSGYKTAISFLVLALFLLFRPHGLFGVIRREEYSS